MSANKLGNGPRTIQHGDVKVADPNQPREFPKKWWSDNQTGDLFFRSRELQAAYGLSTGSASNFGSIGLNGEHKGVFRDHAMRLEMDPQYAAAFAKLLTKTAQGFYDMPALDEKVQVQRTPAEGDGLPIETRVHGHPDQYAAVAPKTEEKRVLQAYVQDGQYVVDVNGKPYPIDNSNGLLPLLRTERDGKQYITINGTEYELEEPETAENK